MVEEGCQGLVSPGEIIFPRRGGRWSVATAATDVTVVMVDEGHVGPCESAVEVVQVLDGLKDAMPLQHDLSVPALGGGVLGDGYRVCHHVYSQPDTGPRVNTQQHGNSPRGKWQMS